MLALNKISNLLFMWQAVIQSSSFFEQFRAGESWILFNKVVANRMIVSGQCRCGTLRPVWMNLIEVQTHTNIHTHTVHAHTCKHTNTHTYIQYYQNIHLCIYTHIQKHSYKNTYIHIYYFTYLHIHINTHKYSVKHTHSNIKSHIR